MKLRTAFIIAGGLVLGGIGLLGAQVVPQPGPPTPIACAFNTSPVVLSDGQAGWVQCTNDGKIQVNATVSTTASVTGFPGSAQSTGTPIAVTTGGVTGTLPSGAVILATNDGATNTAYCKLGASAAVSDIPIYPHSSVAITVGSATQLTCITSTATTIVNMTGGSGLPTGWGGGSASGGGGGGAITAASGSYASGALSSGSVASGAFASGALASGSVASGAMVDLGAVADAASTAGGTGTLSAKLRLMTTQLGTINTTLGTPMQATGGTVAATQSGTWNITNVSGTVSLPTGASTAANQATEISSLATIVTNTGSAIPAGSAIIGKVGIDQTTPGTTNAIQTIAGTTGGASTTGNIAANNTTAVVVKASAGTLYGVQMAGIGSAPAYLKIYNATSATCGSGTPVKRLMIPAASTAANGAGSNISFGDVGIAFGTGITYCITTGIGDADTTAPAASTFLVNLDWK